MGAHPGGGAMEPGGEGGREPGGQVKVTEGERERERSRGEELESPRAEPGGGGAETPWKLVATVRSACLLLFGGCIRQPLSAGREKAG